MSSNRKGFVNEQPKQKRIHQQTVRFNTSEFEAINMYCRKYRITNRSKFVREAVISQILKQLEADYPRLF